MRWSFRTNGNFIDFVHTDETSLAVESTIVSLHNTSRAVSWSLPEDTTRISFTIDEVKYSNIPIVDIDFDGTAMDSQDDFETGIEAMFPGLAGAAGGGGILSASVTLNDAQIRALPTTAIEITAEQGVDKMYVVLFGILRWNCTAAYTNIDEFHMLAVGYGYPPTGEFIDLACSPTEMMNTTGVRTSLLVPAVSPYPATSNIALITYFKNFPELDFNNSSLVIWADNMGFGDFTGGNAANTLKVTVYYVVHDL